MNSFIEQALTRGRIELMDAGLAFRTYCYVTDAVELMFQALLYGTQPVYNIGGHSTVTIGELATIIGHMTGVPVSFPEKPVEVRGAPEEVRLDLALAEQEFKKTKFVDLESGLRATIEWQRSLYKA
jgi:UDP-glucuronate decarboxylase